MILAGVNQDTGLHFDFDRGGISCDWIEEESADDRSEALKKPNATSRLPTFPSLSDALHWVMTVRKGKG